ncbi:nuclease-related domain-containing protein [Nocardioides sp. S-58]|uniref:Nuclease-related domain-containing protein n=1 Tax=Nocardioides renjunii TaxID=3095075 RepID=A0ABU5K8V8_9ACTN|nr:nuclease-related domain-containing protein [Nocardioides sp. S-58]MDZ5661392.1 nuclease-related domain-containing protein [Nocardioides sp. S-58]
MPDEKRMRLRYAGACRVCDVELPAKIEAIYERTTKTVRCVHHDQSRVDMPTVEDPIHSGTPGGSARREFERRAQNRERRIREKHPRLGGLIHAFSDEPQSTKAWDTGALGEERLGSRLNALASDTLRLLHDRRIPGTRANIDHLAVTPTGVFVIDAKKYGGRPHLKIEGGLLRPRVEKLMVGSRNCTKLVDGVLKQADVVRGVVGDKVAVQGVLCFVEADWPLLGGSFTTRGVEVMWPKKLYPLLQAGDRADIDAVDDVYRRLAAALPPA